MELWRTDKENEEAFSDKGSCAQGTGWQAFKQKIRGLKTVSRAEEASLFKEVDLGKKAAALMEGAISEDKGRALISGWQELDEDARRLRLGELKAKGEKAKKRLLDAGLKQALYQAERYHRRVAGAARGVSEEDLFQEGYLGLLKALDGFDISLGLRFCSYAETAITRAMQRAAQNNGRCVRVPVWQQEEAGRINRAREELAHKLKRTPTEAELAQRLEITPERLARLKAAGLSEASLDAPLGEDGDASLGEFLTSEAAEPPEKPC